MGRRADLALAAEALVATDPAFAPVVDEAGPPDLPRGGPRAARFGELARAIVYQQLAGRAAASIHARFAALFGGTPTPEAVVDSSFEALRACGLSGAKARSIQDLAAKVLDGTVELDRLGRLADDVVVAELVQVRGIGRWTAEMFLMFQLGRLDVWPVDDLGVRKGFARLHDLAELPSPKVLTVLGDPFRPHRSVAAWYCWRAADTVLPAPGPAGQAARAPLAD